MEKLNFKSEVMVYENHYELPEEIDNLLGFASEAAKKAYSPYSHFQVGAAILLNNGKIITGNNQENSAYPSGLCAERTAAFYASSQYPEVPFSRIAITSHCPTKQTTEPVTPCGGCRQTLIEYEQKFNQKIEIILSGDIGKVYVFKSVSDLLPFSFHSGYLPK